MFFVADNLFNHDPFYLFLICPIIFVVAQLLHSWVIFPIFVRISKARVMGILFFLLYTAAAVWLCIQLTDKVSNSVFDMSYYLFVFLMCTALAGMHGFADCLYTDEDSWDEFTSFGTEDLSGFVFYWAIIVYVVACIVHPIAAASLFVVGRVIYTFVVAENY